MRDTSIAAGLPDRGPSAAEKLSGEVAKIDQLWEARAVSAFPAPRHWHLACALRLLALAVAIFLLVGSGFFLRMGLWTHSDSWYWESLAGAVVAVFFFALIWKKEHNLYRAQDEWLRHRANAIATSGVTWPDGSELMLKRPAWHFVLFFVSVIAAMLFAFEFFRPFNGISWVGQRDLEISFVISDWETKEPIAGAEIEVPEGRYGQSPFCSECEGPLKLVTDEQGLAKKMCKQCMCFGYSGSRPFFQVRNTFSSHTPQWVVYISAAGYQKSDPYPVDLDVFRRTIQRGDKFATMEVAIGLQRLPALK